MHAAVYNPYWETMGGGERYTASFVKLLQDSGWQVDILWPRDISPEINLRFGIDISGVNFISSTPYSLITNHYQLVFWLSDGSLPTSLAKKTLIHFQFPFKNVGGKIFTNLIKSRFYTFVVNSKFTKSVVDPEFRINSTVVYPPIDTSKFKPGKKTNTILYLGRFSDLTQAKGHALLIDVFKQIYSKISGWELIIAGGTRVGTAPGQLKKLQQQAGNLPLTIITDPEFTRIREMYSHSKIFWSASGYYADEIKDPAKTEHFGISLVEAMAAGCVPLVTNHGGHKEIVDHNLNGFLWDQPGQLADLTLQIIKDPNKLGHLSLAARTRSKIFDISKFNRKFEELLIL